MLHLSGYVPAFNDQWSDRPDPPQFIHWQCVGRIAPGWVAKLDLHALYTTSTSSNPCRFVRAISVGWVQLPRTTTVTRPCVLLLVGS